MIYVCYTVIATLVIRIFNVGITKTVPGEQGVLLTFDDGPHPLYTPLLLDLLKTEQMKAIFFVVGELAEKHPEIIRRMHREGHAIGIHHYRHVSSWSLTPWGLRKQLQKTAEIITQITREEPIFYRPPWGHFNLSSLVLARKYQIVMWSHIYQDWLASKHNLHELALHPPAGGSVLLLHDNGDTPGADEDAPQIMIEYLTAYMDQNNRCNIPYIQPSELRRGAYDN